MATPLFPTVDKRITDSVNDLIAAQVTPWSSLTAGPPFRVKQFDGREVSYQAVSFEGSPQQVFWGGYIEPFLEDLVVRELDFVIRACKEHKVDAQIVLLELQGLLLSGCHKVFARMADVDRRLRGEGYPESVPLRSVKSEQDRMAAFIQIHVSAAIELWKSTASDDRPAEVKESWINSWHKRNPGWAFLIASTIGVIGLWLGLRRKDQEKLPAAPTNPQQSSTLEKKVEPQKPSAQATIDPLQSAIDEFKHYDLKTPEVDVSVKKEGDPQYMAIWERKMRMLGTIEDLARSFHREKEVESFMDSMNNIRVESNAAPLHRKQPRRIKPAQ